MSMNDSGLYRDALDTRQLRGLRAQVQQPTRESVREVAQQFESLFVKTMLKSMRDASMGESMFSGAGVEQYRGMFDQQLALDVSRGGGMGLASMVERQLLQQSGLTDQGKAVQGDSLGDYRNRAVPAAPIPGVGGAPSRRIPGQSEQAVPAEASAPNTGLGAKAPTWRSPEAFVRDLWSAAERTARELDVPPRALIAQAALETGWGRHVIQRGDGGSSHNLFNIKAHHAWSGDTVKVPTLEYRDGMAVRETADFRAYESVDAAFQDYADFLRANPRYAKALRAGSDDEGAFVNALQEGGYATDPRYADKLQRIMDGDTLSQWGNGLKTDASGTTT